MFLSKNELVRLMDDGCCLGVETLLGVAICLLGWLDMLWLARVGVCGKVCKLRGVT